MAVVVVGVDAEHAFELVPVADQAPAEARRREHLRQAQDMFNSMGAAGNLLEFLVDLANGGSWERPAKAGVWTGVEEGEQQAEVMRSREAVQRCIALAKPSPVCG